MSLRSDKTVLQQHKKLCIQVKYLSHANTRKYFFFFFKFLEDMSPFRGATDTPVLDF